MLKIFALLFKKINSLKFGKYLISTTYPKLCPMKQLFLLLLLCISSAFTSTYELRKGVLIVEFYQLKAKNGVVEVSLYNNDKTFLDAGTAFITKRKKVKEGNLQVVFENVPFGDYAAVSYHDVNENHKFDRNFLGIPKEPVAVSKLYKKRFRKPCFQEAKIYFNQAKMVVKMQFVKY